eukprot:g2890.t1
MASGNGEKRTFLTTIAIVIMLIASFAVAKTPTKIAEGVVGELDEHGDDTNSPIGTDADNQEDANGPDSNTGEDVSAKDSDDDSVSELQSQVEIVNTPKTKDVIDFSPSHVLVFSVGKRSEECLFERIELDDEEKIVNGAFFVDSGGDMGIRTTVKKKGGDAMYDTKSVVKEGKFQFPVNDEGVISFCFDNLDSATAKRVVFAMDVEEGDAQSFDDVLKRKHLETSKDTIKRMGRMTRTLEKNVKYMGLRLDNQVIIQDAMNENVVLWSVLESMVVLGVGFAQVYYIQSLIEGRQRVLFT